MHIGTMEYPELNAELSMVLGPLSFLDNSDVNIAVLLGWDGQGSVGEWGFDMRYTAKLQEERVYTLWSDTSRSKRFQNKVFDIPNWMSSCSQTCKVWTLSKVP